MTTPLGGKSYHAFWQDSDGNDCEAADAVTGEITEYDEDGVLLGRTYVDTRHDPEAIASREGDPEDQSTYPENADLLKMGTWDIRRWWSDWEPIDTLPDLLRALDASNADIRAQRDAVGSLMALPAWHPAPETLKAEVRAWLARTVQE